MAKKQKRSTKRQAWNRGRKAWNKGLKFDQRRDFTPEEVKRIRGILARRGDEGLRDLALFSTAIDTMMQGPILLGLKVSDVQSRNGKIRSIIEVGRLRGMPPVRCYVSKFSAKALEKWIAASEKKSGDFLFPGRKGGGKGPLTTRQFSRLTKDWIVDAGLDPWEYGIESLRRTKAMRVLRGTGDLQVVRMLLGHVKIENTARYLGLPTEADPMEVSRAFDY
jgi:integrase